MDKQNEHLDDLKEIRSIMERSSRFISLSGLTGILAGAIAILGSLSVFLYNKDFFIGNYFKGPILGSDMLYGAEYNKLILFLFVVAAVMLVFTFGFGILFTTRNAKRRELPYWDSSAKRMLINLFIPLISGGFFCIALVFHHLLYLVAPSTLIFYGLALINASKYTLNDIRYLGLSEILLGVIAVFFVEYGFLFWTVGFGLLHIVYGFTMYRKYERSYK